MNAHPIPLVATPIGEARYSSILCGCGAAHVVAVARDLALDRPSGIDAVALSALASGWLLYRDAAQWDCPRCVGMSAADGGAFRAAATLRALKLRRALEIG